MVDSRQRRVIDTWVHMATWSLDEGAYLMCDLDPDAGQPKIDPKATTRVSGLYYWLLNQQKKGLLHPVAGKEASARFVPGTLMRHVNDFAKGKHTVSAELFEAYVKKGGRSKPGKGAESRIARDFYVAAAAEIWSQNPNLPAAQVATALFPLPSLVEAALGRHLFSGRSPTRIRRLIGSKGPGAPGRPRKGAPDMGSISLQAIVEKLITQTALNPTDS